MHTGNADVEHVDDTLAHYNAIDAYLRRIGVPTLDAEARLDEGDEWIRYSFSIGREDGLRFAWFLSLSPAACTIGVGLAGEEALLDGNHVFMVWDSRTLEWKLVQGDMLLFTEEEDGRLSEFVEGTGERDALGVVSMLWSGFLGPIPSGGLLLN